MNKKATLQGWTEGIIIAVLFVILFGVVIGGMNTLYSEDHEIVGLDTQDMSDSIETYQESLNEKFKGGDVSFLSSIGMTLSTSWDIISSTTHLIWQFITGGWIRTIIVDYLRLPTQVGIMFQILYFIAIGFLILKLLFKVKA